MRVPILPIHCNPLRMRHQVVFCSKKAHLIIEIKDQRGNGSGGVMLDVSVLLRLFCRANLQAIGKIIGAVRPIRKPFDERLLVGYIQ